ncbi:MAG: 50S ribosomal protein L4 [Thiotrichaceae bacterium]|nr:50S ribosomal protein L4 [Thiotrichaceae bacterium]
MKLPVYKTSGEESGRSVELRDDIYGVEPNDHAIYLDVKQFLANNRQGTHKTKERAEITGSTRKIKRQKGTGTARAGSIKSPIFRGGGRVFGPRVRDYHFKLNKKVKVLARKSALSYKAKDGAIIVIEDFNFDEVKTKNMVSLKQSLNIIEKKVLFVLNQPNNNVYLSSRNLQGVKIVTASELSTYDIMNASKVTFVESSVEAIEQNFGY